MIYYSFYESARMAFLVLLYGALFSVFEIFARAFFVNLGGGVKQVAEVCKAPKLKKSIFLKNRINYKAEIKNKVFLFAFDFLSVLTFSTVFLLISYVFYDGGIRIYFIILSFITYFLTGKFLKIGISFLVARSLNIIFILFSVSAYIVFKPLRLFYKALKKRLYKLTAPILLKKKKIEAKSALYKKTREIRDFFTYKVQI